MKLSDKEIEYALKKILNNNPVKCDIVVEVDEDCGLSDLQKMHAIQVEYSNHFDSVSVLIEGCGHLMDLDSFDETGKHCILKGVLEALTK